jgi:hypothetical protein
MTNITFAIKAMHIDIRSNTETDNFFLATMIWKNACPIRMLIIKVENIIPSDDLEGPKIGVHKKRT